MPMEPFCAKDTGPDWLAFTLACSGVAALRPLGSSFTFRNVAFVRTPSAGGTLSISLLATPSTTASTLLAFASSWLEQPSESLSIAGDPLVLTPAFPSRTAEEARLGVPVSSLAGSPPPTRTVVALPWCSICLTAAAGSDAWSCRGSVGQHRFCQNCIRRYAQTQLVAGSYLRCPAPGCNHTLAVDELRRLVPIDELQRLRAEAFMSQTARLKDIREGKEGPELQSLLADRTARPCPTCSVIVIKWGGCCHMSCNVCGTPFNWE